MKVFLHDGLECVTGLGLEFVLVALAKDKEALVPQDGQLPIIGAKVAKVLDETPNDGCREGILFVEEGLDENGRRTIVLVLLGQFVDRHGRMVHRDGYPLQHGRHNGCLPKSALFLAKRQENSLEKGGGLVDGLFEGHVVVVVEFLVGVNVGPDAVEQHQVVEPLSHLGIQVGSKDAGCGKHGLRGPHVWARQIQDFFPIAKGRNNLEGLG